MILIVGNFTNSEIVRRRKLPSPNPAASSRMIRIAKSLKSNDVNVAILSSGNAASIGFNMKFIDKSFFICRDDIKIHFASVVTVPILSAFWELISLPILFLKIAKKDPIDAVVLYCYYPSILIIGLISKLKKIKIVEDLQDIVADETFSYFDFSFLDFLRQKLGKVLMKATLKISDVVIVPTSKFLKFIPANKNTILISGCFDTMGPRVYRDSKSEKIHILFSGLLNRDQGIGLFFETLRMLNNVPNVMNKYKFLICGYGFDESYVRNEVVQMTNIDVDFLGYVDSVGYESLLQCAHVCMAIQDPNGVFGMLKTPSKAFEYMVNGKMVIVSNVGDFSKFASKEVVLLENYNSVELFNIINNLTFEQINQYGRNARNYATENWSFEIVGSKIIDSISNNTFVK